MARKSLRSAAVDTAEDTARILFLAYGREAVDMAVLRCAELKRKGDRAGFASWRKVLGSVRKLAAANPGEHGTVN
jgi:hypothetical protein